MSELKNAREDRGIKLSAVARHVGVSRQTYAGYEAHPEKMSVDKARQACDFLGASFEDIFLNRKVS